MGPARSEETAIPFARGQRLARMLVARMLVARMLVARMLVRQLTSSLSRLGQEKGPTSFSWPFSHKLQSHRSGA